MMINDNYPSISSNTLQSLTEILYHIPLDKLDRIKKVVAYSGYSEEVVDIFLQALTQIGDKMSMTMNLEEILALDEVQEHLRQKVDEAVQNSEITHREESADIKAGFENELQVLRDEKNTSAQEYHALVVDSIVFLSTILRKDVIDFNDEAGSQEKYREELSSSSEEELKETLSELQGEYIASFSNVPAESLDGEVVTESGQRNPSEGSDGDEKAVTISSLGDVLKVAFKSIGKNN